MASKQDYREHPDFREYVRWEALPSWKREDAGLPATQKEWAEEHGYSPRTLQKWKNRPEWDELMGELTEQWIKDSVPQVVEAAKEVATTPEPSGHNDRKLILNLAGKGNKMTIRHEGEVEHNHSLEEVRTMDEGALRTAVKTELRKRPQFAEASDEELEGMISAFVDANTSGASGALPSAAGPSAKDPEYVLSDTPPDSDS